MILTPDEREAVIEASPAVGAFLERIGKTDLATMTESEWFGFLTNTYQEIKSKVWEIYENDVPF